MPNELSLTAAARVRSGSTGANAARKAGKLPAVLYGHGSEPALIEFDLKAFEDVMHRGGRSSLITLRVDGRRGETALLRELQRDPLSRRIIHADLQRVSANEEVHSSIPVVSVGVALGVKEFGGVLDIVTHQVEISGPANKIPDHIEVDVSSLGLHDHVTAAEANLPEGFVMLTPPDTILVAVEPSKTATQVEEAATPAPQAEPELVGEKTEVEPTQS
ncbi:MAG: 50S ribosomal protein L25 [Candidatus Eremiobacteraeota bacterium]|nr:50S ribosomal protein L25 [Candidatus Eremiobacteraeota bacterium]